VLCLAVDCESPESGEFLALSWLPDCTRVGAFVQGIRYLGKRCWFRLHEKGGKRHEVPAHHNAEAYLDAYLAATHIADDRKGPLFRSLDRRRCLTARRLDRLEVLAMIKRRAWQAGLPQTTCCHTFRATGITTHLQNCGTIEHAQQISAHESPRTTKLYDRTSDAISLDDRAHPDLIFRVGARVGG